MNSLLENHYLLPTLLGAFILFRLVRQMRTRSKVRTALSDNPLIVDVRSPEEFRAGHAQGSINIPLANLENRYQELDSKRSIVLCCASGLRSSQAESFLRRKGFEKIMNGGSWTNAT